MPKNVDQQTRKTAVKSKLSPSRKRWIIFSIASFVLGVIVAQIFVPSTTTVVKEGGQMEMAEGNSGSSQPLPEKEQTGFMIIIIAVGILALLIALAYYREKRKN